MHTSAVAPVVQQIFEPSWVSVAAFCVHGVVLVGLIAFLYALEHAVPRWFYGGIGLLRHTPVLLHWFGGGIEQWNTVYLTNDKALATHTLPLGRDEVGRYYTDCVGMCPPPDQSDLWCVEEAMTVLRLRKWRVCWSNRGAEPDRMRLHARATSSGLIAGRWFDHDSGTDHKGSFLVVLDRARHTGSGCWCGPSNDDNTVRVFPWKWTRLLAGSVATAL